VREDGLDQIGGGVAHMLAVIENQQADSAPPAAAATLSPRSTWLLSDAQHRCTASGTAAGSATAASSKNQTPSGNSSARPAATSVARRVLPTPPTPVNVNQPMGSQRACHLGDFGFAPYEAVA